MRLSIITVCRNEICGIRDTINSVKSQDYHAYEYIVIDGNSTDGTVGVLEENTDYITRWISEPDQGIYDAMNKGIEMARGEYLMFLNGGDRLAGESVLSTLFAARPTADLVYGDVYKETGGELRLCSYSCFIPSERYMFSHTLPHPATLIKASLFKTAGNYRVGFRICGDYEFFLRAVVTNGASTQYLSIPIAVFNTEGISHSRQGKIVRKKEDALARKLVFGAPKYFIMKIFDMCYDLLYYRPKRKFRKMLRKQ